MKDRTGIVVIEARSLMREALVSLMESHSYHVICSVGSTADIDRGVLKEAQPELVLLGALPTDRVANATSSIRRWPAVVTIAAELGPARAGVADRGRKLGSPRHPAQARLEPALQLLKQGPARAWSFADAAPQGSSWFGLPPFLHWLTGNIGFHHVHHLNPRVPRYRFRAAHEAVHALLPTP